MAETRKRATSLDWLVLLIAVGALTIAAYEFNLAGLGRRLVAETSAWLAEQRPPRPDVSRETPVDEQLVEHQADEVDESAPVDVSRETTPEEGER